MSVLTAIFIYFLIWWVMLFTVLPLGVERHAEEGKGHDAGAPRRPDLRKKLAINTVLSALVLGAVWWMAENGIIQWGNWFREAIK